MFIWREKLSDAYRLFEDDINTLIEQAAVPISEAEIPNTSGIYMFLFEDQIVYIGEAKGSGGLRDRITRKHLSGDDSHALQRFFAQQLPDRTERREFIRQNVYVKWVTIDDIDRVAIVERLAIWLFRPMWNMT